MKPPAGEIDGAKVLMYADVSHLKKTSAIRHFDENGLQDSFQNIAICTYGKDDQVYLFHCNAEWETENDDIYQSMDEAVDSAMRQYLGLKRENFIHIERAAPPGSPADASSGRR